MKKLALLLCCLAGFTAFSLSASTNTEGKTEPQYQEQCAPAPCDTPTTVCNQVPCNVPVNAQNSTITTNGAVPCTTTVVPCATDTVCNPAPCDVPVNCDAPVNCTVPANNQSTTPAPATAQNQVYNVCC